MTRPGRINIERLLSLGKKPSSESAASPSSGNFANEIAGMAARARAAANKTIKRVGERRSGTTPPTPPVLPDSNSGDNSSTPPNLPLPRPSTSNPILLASGASNEPTEGLASRYLLTLRDLPQHYALPSRLAVDEIKCDRIFLAMVRDDASKYFEKSLDSGAEMAYDDERLQKLAVFLKGYIEQHIAPNFRDSEKTSKTGLIIFLCNLLLYSVQSGRILNIRKLVEQIKVLGANSSLSENTIIIIFELICHSAARNVAGFNFNLPPYGGVHLVASFDSTQKHTKLALPRPATAEDQKSKVVLTRRIFTDVDLVSMISENGANGVVVDTTRNATAIFFGIKNQNTQYNGDDQYQPFEALETNLAAARYLRLARARAKFFTQVTPESSPLPENLDNHLMHLIGVCIKHSKKIHLRSLSKALGLSIESLTDRFNQIGKFINESEGNDEFRIGIFNLEMAFCYKIRQR